MEIRTVETAMANKNVYGVYQIDMLETYSQYQLGELLACH